MASALASAVAPAPATPSPRELFDDQVFDAAELVRDPFDHLLVPGFVRPEALAAINRDYPAIEGPGNHPPEGLSYGPAFATLLDELRSPAFADRIGAKFGVDLTGCVPTIAIRRFCEATDGNIHTDHKSKVITLLLYFNEVWPHQGGRLRLLRSATDIEDYVTEVEPAAGNLIAFRRTENSFHGHEPHVGERRFLQLMWPRGGDLSRTVSKLTKPIRRLLNMS
jgi:SM-20-related protein